MLVHRSASGIDTNRAARSEIRVTPLVELQERYVGTSTGNNVKC